MIKYSEIKPLWKTLTNIAGILTAFSVIIAAASWAADTKYQTLVAQAEYVEKVADEDMAQEVRQLKRDIKRLELKEESGNASAEDRAFVKFLQQDLEDLQTQ